MTPRMAPASEAATAPAMPLPARRLTQADFAADACEVAPRLIGATLLVDTGAGACAGGLIVEAEAYDQSDPASHTFGGPTLRTRAMFGPPGHAYIYRSYGMHWCLNFVCREAGHGAGVLIRALQPLHGLPAMRARRGLPADADARLLCAGPGRLAQALGITQAQYGLPLDAPPFALLAAPPGLPVVAGPRIGIRKAAHVPWRFGLAGSRFVSKPFAPARG